jgi:hypothetical protein
MTEPLQTVPSPDDSWAASLPAAPLVEMLHGDFSRCWQQGERLPVEAYLDREPDLRQSDDQVLELIFHEVRLRVRLGETPRLDEYVRRFPHLRSRLESRFEADPTPQPANKSAGHTVVKDVAVFTPSSAPGASPEAPAPPLPDRVADYEILDEIG